VSAFAQLSTKHTLGICLFLALSTLGLYWPVTRHEFVNYDDTDYVTQNAHVQAGVNGKSVAWVWKSEVARNWHPVTMLSHMLDCQFFGMKPGWHHLTNLLFHVANTLLLRLGRFDEAIAHHAAVARARPEYLYYFNLANALGAQDKLAESIPHYQKALQLAPNDFQTHYNLGLTLVRQGRRAEAKTHFTEALRLHSDYPEARKALADLDTASEPLNRK